MTMTVESIAPTASDAERSFSNDVDDLRKKHRDLWQRTDASLPHLGETISTSRQRENAHAADRFTDEMEAHFRGFPNDEAGREPWRQDLRRRLRNFGTTMGMPEDQRDVVFSDDFFHVTTDFVRRARSFDRSLEIEDLFQALRNVWIMSILRRILGSAMACTPSVFAYSLLYPYTDNVLDDSSRDVLDKLDVSRWLGQRLRGESVAPRDRYEADLSRLLGLIDEEYPRASFPRVWDSLLAIHRAQVRSLDQQAPASGPGDDLLGFSIAKGGTSVLADGYLVHGDLSPEQADFIFGFGVVLQLLDDMQDIRTDREAGHRTIFTESVSPDATASRLCRFMDHVLDATPLLSVQRNQVVRKVIRTHCRLLLLHAVAFHEDLYPVSFVRELECHAPFPFAFLRKRRGSVRERSRGVRKTLRRRGIDSIFDVLA
jgi:hypothetical protein